MPETDATRTDGGGGNQKHRFSYDDDECAGFEGATARLRGWSSAIGRPCRPIKIAEKLAESVVTAAVGIDLPLYGDGVYEAVNNGTPAVTLDTGGTGQGISGGIPTWLDLAGCLNVPWEPNTATHASSGQGRLIVAYNTSSRVATLERAFGTAPTTSSTGRFYRNLIDCRWYSELRLKVELSHDAAQAVLEVILFGWPKSRAAELAPSTTVRRPMRMGDYLLTVTSLGDSADVEETSGGNGAGGLYFNGRFVSAPCKGMYGALVRVKSITAGHSISVWVAPS